MEFLVSEEKLSRRELFESVWPARDVVPVIDGERCTGCGICAMDCPTKALTVSQSDEEGSYQILFQQEICDGCRICGKSCPEQCLKLNPVRKEDGKHHEVVAIFEDRVSHCNECGVPLFPQAMVRLLKSKMLAIGQAELPFDLCPSCRMRRRF